MIGAEAAMSSYAPSRRTSAHKPRTPSDRSQPQHSRMLPVNNQLDELFLAVASARLRASKWIANYPVNCLTSPPVLVCIAFESSELESVNSCALLWRGR